MKEILGSIKTMEDRQMLLKFLGELSQRIFDPTLDLSVQFEKSDIPFSGKLKQYFIKEIEYDNSELTLRKIKELEQALKNIPKVTLTTAILPDDNIKEKVWQHFVDADKPVIIDFVKDENLIGGAVIEDSGTIFEHSFRDYFAKRKGGKI